jgi:hypothetical protein
MACYEYKITFEYDKPLAWTVSIWQREVGVYRERSAWRRLLVYEAATLEGHLDATDRMRMIMRHLAG